MNSKTARPSFLKNLKHTLKIFGGSLKNLKQDPLQPRSEKINIKPNTLQVWMIGHATTLINFYGTVILTDPVFSDALPIPKRVVKAAYRIKELPLLDVVFISHAHRDHLDKASLRQLSKKTKTVVVSRNCSRFVKRAKFKRMLELDWGQEQKLNGLTVKAFKPVHWGERYPWQTYLNLGYNSYLLKKNGKSVFFCGDSAYGEFFKSVSNPQSIDLAILPIGAYLPPSFRKHHMDPADALKAFSDLRAKYLIPIHWGNFRLSLEPLDEPPKRLAELAAQKGVKERVYILKNGESFELT